ncbi:4-amino-4-deoxychorismate lyase [Tistlia consotensis]|uniref:Probable branched-chain-amino-acid aminotransferase n=1 Tax=Tistlia consotensis USBA 355 TaxID=560819 RepID=A0A1Y6CAH1_9PROT|nr:aminotransferase class IV [Tistlia consotensis]SMF53321.1 4-amino-4-deoxychorismate lyase [Tistlia consotensis USBA 355]SNR85367.1 4-amino-4-deoxychorismate lyase [Tistlia consotensis]
MPGLRLIETLLWRAGEGAPRLPLHLARLRRSAAALGFACDPAEAVRAVEAAAAGRPEWSLRIRLTLARDGTLAATATAFAALPPDSVWTLVVSERRLDQSDPLLRHKTDRRALYDGERARLLPGSGAEEVLFLNRAGRVADGGITCLYAADPAAPERLRTPPLAEGCLDSVLRAELLAAGRAREAPLSLGELRAAPALFVGNALRGLIRARLAG